MLVMSGSGGASRWFERSLGVGKRGQGDEQDIYAPIPSANNLLALENCHASIRFVLRW
jgi:hypothetical protein